METLHLGPLSITHEGFRIVSANEQAPDSTFTPTTVPAELNRDHYNTRQKWTLHFDTQFQTISQKRFRSATENEGGLIPIYTPPHTELNRHQFKTRSKWKRFTRTHRLSRVSGITGDERGSVSTFSCRPC